MKLKRKDKKHTPGFNILEKTMSLGHYNTYTPTSIYHYFPNIVFQVGNKIL